MSLIQIGLIIFGGIPILGTIMLAYQLMRNGQGAIGKPTIQPFIFYSVKLSIVVLMSILFLACYKSQVFLLFPMLIQNEIPEVQKLLSLVLLLGGNLLLLPAYVSLSIFTRVGLPTGKHALETKGIYRISRNPMYTSFFFYSISCFLLVPSLLVAVIILFITITHHFIILKEEQFLVGLFSKQYLDYKSNTARYL